MDYYIAKNCFIISIIILMLWTGQLILTAGKKQAEKLQESINNSLSIMERKI